MTEKEFSIFLPKAEISQDEIGSIDINSILLKDDSIISESDLIAYDKTTHSLKLSASSCERVMSLKYGTIVFVCVGRKPIYWGVIWSNILSAGFNGVVLLKAAPWEKDKCKIRIECGYPSEWFTGKDPRDNPEIMNSLRKAGKLKTD